MTDGEAPKSCRELHWAGEFATAFSLCDTGFASLSSLYGTSFARSVGIEPADTRFGCFRIVTSVVAILDSTGFALSTIAISEPDAFGRAGHLAERTVVFPKKGYAGEDT